MFISIAYAMGQAAQQAQCGEAPNPLSAFMPLILMFGIIYFLLIRPQQKKQKDHNKMISELKKNDSVITTGGIYGTIVNVKDATFILKVDDGVKIEISKSAVAGLKNPS